MIRKFLYRRKVIYVGQECEVVLIHWPPGARSPAHDHGKSRGVIWVLEGRVFQQVFAKKSKKFLFRKTYGKGESFQETPKIIHIMGNASKKKPATTLHIYTPKLLMKKYTLS